MQRPTVRTRIADPCTPLIASMSNPEQTDSKTRSKWARALRLAEANKAKNESVTDFIRRRGGINKCAGRWGR